MRSQRRRLRNHHRGNAKTRDEKDSQRHSTRSIENGAHLVLIIILVLIRVGSVKKLKKDSAGCALRTRRVRLVSRKRKRKRKIVREAKGIVDQKRERREKRRIKPL